MKDIEMEKNFNFRFKCIALAILAIAFIVAFIPLWQLGIDNTIRHEMIVSQIALQDLDYEERALIASSSNLDDEEYQSTLYVKANSVI